MKGLYLCTVGQFPVNEGTLRSYVNQCGGFVFSCFLSSKPSHHEGLGSRLNGFVCDPSPSGLTVILFDWLSS